MTEEEGAPEPEEAVDLDKLADELRKPAEDVELTPEEEEQLRQAAARIRKVLHPQVTSALANMQSTRTLGRITKDINRWKRLGMADSFLNGSLGQGALSKTVLGKGISRKGVIASNFPTKSVLPSWKFEQPWAKQLKFVNSDIYKSSGLGQGNLTAFNSVLARNADFGLNKTAAKWASQFARQQDSWLKTIGPKLATLKFNIYPSNLQDIEGLRLVEVEEVVMLDGIALYGVPRREIAERLVRADSTGARREILGRRWKAISSDCRNALEDCTSTSVAEYVAFAVDALDAFDGGNSRAAQALAASVLDTVVNGYLGKDRFKLTPNRKTTTPAEYDELTVSKFIAMAPLWQAYQKYRVEEGDPIPHTFSRHASVHGVSSRQFSRRNAVQALLFVSSLLLFLDEEAVFAEAA